MTQYCMDYRDYTTLRNVKEDLDGYSKILEDFKTQIDPSVGLDWAQFHFGESADKLGVVLDNLYVKPFKEVQ